MLHERREDPVQRCNIGEGPEQLEMAFAGLMQAGSHAHDAKGRNAAEAGADAKIRGRDMFDAIVRNLKGYERSKWRRCRSPNTTT